MNKKCIIFVLLCASFASNVSSVVPFEQSMRRFDARLKILHSVLQTSDADRSKQVEPVARLIVRMAGPVERPVFRENLQMLIDTDPTPFFLPIRSHGEFARSVVLPDRVMR